MADRTAIEWADASWNPIRAQQPEGSHPHHHPGWHCEVLTPGCINCYAAAINKRLGTGLAYLRNERSKVSVHIDEKILAQPLHWKRPRRIFVCSMSDLFGEWVPDEMIDRVMVVAALCPQHQFLVLTKRAARMREYLSDALDGVERERWRIAGPLPALERHWPLPNVWLGVSVEDQRRADERIPELLATPAAVRWVSAEPLLGPIERLTEIMPMPSPAVGRIPGLDWVVVGGESGPGARPFDLAWCRSIVAQCQAADVACFVKQIGTRPHSAARADFDLNIRDRKGGDPAEWPEDLRVREFPA